MSETKVVVIGGGPAGLMAAEQILKAGYRVDLYDSMPSLGRKFLLAGRGGLNLTHAEAAKTFRSRFYQRQHEISQWLDRFDSGELRRWADELGAETFVGSSGRVFPNEMKAAPLLRNWLRRLRAQGLRTHVRHRWLGWDENGWLLFERPAGSGSVNASATVLALGGASWPKLGSDGGWLTLLQDRGVDINPFRPSNCGFEVEWTPIFRDRNAGLPLKNVVLTVVVSGNIVFERRGEMVVSEYGVEGNLVYAASAWIRDALESGEALEVALDLMPDRDMRWLRQRLRRPAGKRSISNHLRKTIGLDGLRLGMLRERLDNAGLKTPQQLIPLIKQYPIAVKAPRPISEVISSSGGIRFSALDEKLMLKQVAGLFCAGEMIDWEAPTGGYLLTACFASGVVAGEGVVCYLRQHE